MNILKFLNLIFKVNFDKNYILFNFQTPEDGAQTAIYLACANEVQNVSGRFFADLVSICKPKQLENQRLCETIWEKSEKVVKLKKDELI